ncbi:type 4a pilus biogenesis protein PilO [Curtobacterium sp. MCBA15_001]|uniref:type 4a pilus biogenesis protein PilO n=1 Tax=Curtobacterium sp. MCBA15_001 TaxID=1898731 RepID=UPI0008DD0F5F|nr:type 4a pilus biogenesis protein PilO [Curtobacterium sp. MCBA15_001]OIH95375.1 hypothetical protein BIU90_01310 [Curtobacterium sp. MCBA15_001]
MSKNRLQLVIALAVGLLVVLGGALLGVQPQLAQASANREQRSQIDATNRTYQAELARLRAQAQKLEPMKQQLSALQASVPSTADIASFYKEIDQVGTTSRVTVSGVTVADAVAYAPPEVSEPAVAATPAAGATPAPTAAPSPTTPVAPTPKTDSKITSANFSTIAVSIDVVGDFSEALAFARGMQNGPRLFLVNDLKAQQNDAVEGATTSSMSWSLSGYVYVLADAKTAHQSQTTATPSATPAAG